MNCLPVAIRLACVIGFLLPQVAVAGGLGGYLEYARGKETLDLPVGDVDFTNNRYGAGIVLDSNVSRNELIHVRANAGYVRTQNTDGDKAHGAIFEIGMGMGFWRTHKFRAWAGPTIHVGADYYDFQLDETWEIGVGGGLRLGLNWHVTPRISLSPSIAYQYLYVQETAKDAFGDTLTGSEQLITARVTVLFRDAKDVFRSRRRARSGKR